MLLLNVSKRCMSLVTRLPSSLNCTPCIFRGKDPNNIKTCLVQFRRNIGVNNCFSQISRQESKESHLAVSRPRLYKQLHAEKIEDNVPKDWDLIFSQGRNRLKLKVAHWACFVGALVLPVCLGLGLWQNADEEDVIVGGISVAKNTEFSLFMAVNGLVLVVLYRVIRNIPIRMYFNNAQEKYTAIMPARIPWQTRRFEFTAMDVRSVPSLRTPVMLKPWKHNEFRVLNRLIVLPHMCFHNGHDRHMLLRFKDVPDNMRK